MYPRGIIYDAHKSSKSGSIRIVAALGVRIAYQFIRGTGAGFVSLALIGVIFTYGPIIKEELRYTFGVKRHDFSNNLDLIHAQETAQIQKEAASYKLNSYFSVVIPKIEAKSNIIANVDPAVETEYLSALQRGVAHAKGTYFPGQDKTIYLFSHSTNSPINIARYNAVFYLLRKLEKGDKIIIFFADKKYVYKVTDKLVVADNDVSWLTDQGLGERLILQTCHPPGTTFGRLLVIAQIEDA